MFRLQFYKIQSAFRVVVRGTMMYPIALLVRRAMSQETIKRRNTYIASLTMF